MLVKGNTNKKSSRFESYNDDFIIFDTIQNTTNNWPILARINLSKMFALVVANSFFLSNIWVSLSKISNPHLNEYVRATEYYETSRRTARFGTIFSILHTLKKMYIRKIEEIKTTRIRVLVGTVHYIVQIVKDDRYEYMLCPWLARINSEDEIICVLVGGDCSPYIVVKYSYLHHHGLSGEIANPR